MSTFARRLLPAWLFGLVLLLPSTARAQFDTATVLGTVRDPNGAVVPGATVTLRNPATGTAVTAQTDEDGGYQFLNVKIGIYEVSAEVQGSPWRAPRR